MDQIPVNINPWYQEPRYTEAELRERREQRERAQEMQQEVYDVDADQLQHHGVDHGDVGNGLNRRQRELQSRLDGKIFANIL